MAGQEGGARGHFDSIYAERADAYHEMVMREDPAGNLRAVLPGVVDVRAKTVAELGAGTGRVTKILAREAAQVRAFDRAEHMLARARLYLAEEIARGVVTLNLAENLSLPLADASVDAVVEGWSFGHTVSISSDAWRDAAKALLAESSRVLRAGGTLVLIETLGTGAKTPSPPGPILPLFYAWLEKEQGFSARTIRTDYVFESVAQARALTEFFFGALPEHDLHANGSVTVPECTGLWWRRKEG